MNYRLYVNGTAGYYELGTYGVDETICCLNWLIMEEKTKERILAIECNKERNIEFPVFIYGGNPGDFLRFKEYLMDHDIGNKITKQYVRKERKK